MELKMKTFVASYLIFSKKLVLNVTLKYSRLPNEILVERKLFIDHGFNCYCLLFRSQLLMLKCESKINYLTIFVSLSWMKVPYFLRVLLENSVIGKNNWKANWDGKDWLKKLANCFTLKGTQKARQKDVFGRSFSFYLIFSSVFSWCWFWHQKHFLYFYDFTLIQGCLATYKMTWRG